MDHEPDLTRRMTISAIAGMLAGLANVGEAAAAQVTAVQEKKSKPADESNPLLVEPHVCRGLNTCKGLGADHQNACAGQGVCATAPHHTCAGNNECRGLGACYQGDPKMGQQPEFPGENTCKGHGGCEVPLRIQSDPKQRVIWNKARWRFKFLMKDVKNVDIGVPPMPR